MRLVIKLDKKYNTESFIQIWLKKAIYMYLREQIIKNKNLIIHNFNNDSCDVYKNLLYVSNIICQF